MDGKSGLIGWMSLFDAGLLERCGSMQLYRSHGPKAISVIIDEGLHFGSVRNKMEAELC